MGALTLKSRSILVVLREEFRHFSEDGNRRLLRKTSNVRYVQTCFTTHHVGSNCFGPTTPITAARVASSYVRKIRFTGEYGGSHSVTDIGAGSSAIARELQPLRKQIPDVVLEQYYLVRLSDGSDYVALTLHVDFRRLARER
jgi:hypothetical protein